MFYAHLNLWWFVVGSITNFLIFPYYVCKAIKIFGFRSFDFLDVRLGGGQRSLWNKSKVIRNIFFLLSVLTLSLQFGGIKSYLILDRYEIDTWFGYGVISFIVGFLMIVIGAFLPHFLLVLIQYKYFFSQIPNPELHHKNPAGE